MPEMPEIAALAALLTRRTEGRTIDTIVLRSFAALKTYEPGLPDLRGRIVKGWSRRGKFLLLDTDGLWLVLHLARAGWIRWSDETAIAPARPGRGPIALTVGLAGGGGFAVTEQGTEKRLAVFVVRDPMDVPAITRLGPDPLDPALDAPAFAASLRALPGQMKSVLTDQAAFAGIGNAYSDEILHAARMSPYRRAASITDDEATALHGAIRHVLTEAISRASDVAPSDLKSEKRSGMAVHGRSGEPCPACGDTIEQVSLSGRSFQYCPTCQTGGRTLSDRRLSRLLK